MSPFPLDDGVTQQELQLLRQMFPQESLRSADVQQLGEQVLTQTVFVDEQSAVDTGASQIRRVLGQIDVPQPLHEPVVGPQGHFFDTVLRPARGASLQTSGIEICRP